MSQLRLVEPTQMSFDYAVLDTRVATETRQAAERIKLRLRRSAEDIIEIGRDLLAVKDKLPHGSFLPWIEAEFGMTDRTARRFMDVSRVYAGKSDIVSNIDSTALYELAAPKTPLEVREEVEKMIAAGEVVTKATVQELQAKVAGLEKAQSLADEEIAAKASRVSELEETIDETVGVRVSEIEKKTAQSYADEIKRLKDEIADLKKPRPGVTTIDNETGKVLEFRKPQIAGEETSDQEDEYEGANFNDVASQRDRALAAFGCIRSIVSVSADPKYVYEHMTENRTKKAISEHVGMLETAISFLQSVKDIHNG